MTLGAVHFQISRYLHMLLPLPGTHLSPWSLIIHSFNYGSIQEISIKKFLKKKKCTNVKFPGASQNLERDQVSEEF